MFLELKVVWSEIASNNPLNGKFSMRLVEDSNAGTYFTLLRLFCILIKGVPHDTLVLPIQIHAMKGVSVWL